MALADSEVVDNDRGSNSADPVRLIETETPPQVEVPRVLILAFTFPPWAAAGTFRTLRFVRYLSTYGWEPLVLTAQTESFPHIPTDVGLNAWIPPATIVQRTTVLRPFHRLTAAVRWLLPQRSAGSTASAAKASVALPARRVNKPGYPLRSALRSFKELFSIPDQQVGWMLPALTAALQMVRKYRPRVLYSSGPPHSSHLAALLVKKFTGLPLVLDFRDPWARWDWDFGLSALSRRIQNRLERLCVSRADKVILNTESLCREFRENYPAKWHHKFVTITNGYDPELRARIETLVADTDADAKPHSGGEFLLCHAGAVYGERRLEPLVAAIAILNRRGHRIVLEQIGRIADKDALERTIGDHEATSYIKLTSHRPHDEVMRRTAEADAHVLLQPGTAIQIPSKLFEMMMFGKPIFALAGPGETSNTIRKYGLGASIETEDPMLIAVELERFITDRPRAVSANAAALADFDGRQLTGQLAGVFESLIGETTGSQCA